ncbi:hypothetical protein AAG570_009839 [Ranatra chinensis]|uniref:Enkurin domain-containing protein n=1 Tax=Ranatra chinensis TaxID=642074 RepID=A0ABD0Z118_9HEMI
MYRSKFSEKVREDVKKVKDCHRTMGFPPDYPGKGPSYFLKKGTRLNLKQDVEKTKLVFPPKMKVPRRDEWTKPLVKPLQNFVYTNAIDVIRSGPKHGSRRVWDSSTGDQIHSCVIEPKFVFHKGFGKVPKYVNEFKTKQKAVKDNKEKNEEPTEYESAYQIISKEDRDKIIKGLKKIWEAKQEEFRLLPMVVETPPQIKRKTQMERDLDALEKEIDKLERNKIIYVYDESGKKCYCHKNK